MRGPSRLRAGLAACFAVAMLAVPSTAFAAPPVIEPFVDSAGEAIDCGSFQAWLQRDFTGLQTVYLDGDGEASRIQVVAHLTGSLSTGSVSIALSGDLLVVLDLVRGTFSFSGRVISATAPGRGVVLQDTGRLLVDASDTIIVLAGPHDAIEQGVAAFCRALA